MANELIRIEILLEERGINVVPRIDDKDKRYIDVENQTAFGRIFRTIFEIPESIDLEKVVWWFVNKTKYHGCTVFTQGRTPTTITTNKDIEWYFK